MSGGLALADGGDDEARCARCGAPAAGPCASCAAPVCGDCCELTEGGTKAFAVCLACARAGGGSLAPGWRAVVLWALAPLLVLALAVALLALAAR